MVVYLGHTMTHFLLFFCLITYSLSWLLLFRFQYKKQKLIKAVTPILNARVGWGWSHGRFIVIDLLFDFAKMNALKRHFDLLPSEFQTQYLQMMRVRQLAFLMFALCLLVGCCGYQLVQLFG